MTTHLPFYLTDFVGHEDDIVALKQLMITRRLVTLIGTGGIGKTRLALQVAAAVESQFADGVYMVQFASLSDPALVPQLVASTLGIREQMGRTAQQTLLEALQSKHVLLVFDNCEHMITACATLALFLLQHCLHLHVLATSREGLRVTGEILWRVAPLTYPALTVPISIEQFMRYDAVQLFCDRAVLVEPQFAITPQNMEAVAHICQHLDGIPLALELAAARMQILSAEQLEARLDERFQVLTDGNRAAPPRHQTLQAVLDWSYALLSTFEQAILQRLAVFGGSWTLEAMMDICADEQSASYQMIDIITQLVHKSWVIAEENREEKVMRYRLLETIQQYARQRLPTLEDFQHLCVRHWEWYLHFAEEAAQHLHGAEQAKWFQHVACEIDNLRLALERSLAARQVEVTARIAAAMGAFWVTRSRLSEGGYWYEVILGLADLSTELRIVILQQAVEILRFQGEYDRVRSLLEERVALLRTSSASAGLAETCCSLGWNAFYQGECDEAIKYCTEGLKLFTAAGDQRGRAECLSVLALVAVLQQKYPRARAHLQEVIFIRRELHDHALLAYALNAQARVAVLQGEKILASNSCREALQLVSTLKQPFGSAYCFEAVAALAGACADTTRAVQLFGAAHALRTAIGIPFPPSLRAWHEREILPLRVQQGEDLFAAQWAQGQAFSLDQAYAEAALAIEQARISSDAAPSALAGLSQREIDVLRLVGTGLTDAQVAQELALSTRTVSTHLRSIYQKLGVTSRSAATSLAVEHHLL